MKTEGNGTGMEEKKLELIIRECYASALEASAKMRERMAVNAETGDPMLVVQAKLQLKEREQAADRIRTVCIRHGFNLEKKEE